VLTYEKCDGDEMMHIVTGPRIFIGDDVILNEIKEYHKIVHVSDEDEDMMKEDSDGSDKPKSKSDPKSVSNPKSEEKPKSKTNSK